MERFGVHIRLFTAAIFVVVSTGCTGSVLGNGPASGDPFAPPPVTTPTTPPPVFAVGSYTGTYNEDIKNGVLGETSGTVKLTVSGQGAVSGTFTPTSGAAPIAFTGNIYSTGAADLLVTPTTGLSTSIFGALKNTSKTTWSGQLTEMTGFDQSGSQTLALTLTED